MKLAMIGHKDFPSRAGGVEVVVSELAPRLARRGWEVAVYNRGRRKGHNHEFLEGVEVFRCATSRRQSLNALIYSITATLRALPGGYDLIHYHALGPSVMLLAARLAGKKTVATVHGLDWQRAKWNRIGSAYLKFGEWVIARFAHEVIVLSREVQDYFQTVYGRDTHFIPNAVTPVPPSGDQEIRARFGLEKNEYILFLARLVPEKGLHLLIEAFRRCDTGKKLVIAGQVPDNDYGRSLLHQAEGCDRIRFLGFVEGEALNELYCGCALYVLPSQIEGMALTLLEAMSAGARCLTSDIPENRAVLRDFGATFRSGDVDSLHEKLCQALSEPDENPRAAEQRAYILEHYNYDTMVQETESVYRMALEGGKQR